MNDRVMHVEQAIFTSVKSDRMDGYQVASASYGVHDDDIRELASWGPAHDSLLSATPLAKSVNFHRLSSGTFAVSKTTAAHAEYSGRGGRQVYTHYLLVSPPVLARFANNPFRVLEAVTAMGKTHVFRRIPPHLERLTVVGRATPVDATLLAELNYRPGPAAMTSFLAAVIAGVASRHVVGVTAKAPLHRIFAGLVSLLPPACRTQISFSTGLRYSPRRDFQIIALPSQRDQQRRLLRVAPIKRVDLSGAGTETLCNHHGYVAQIEGQLTASRFDELKRKIAAVDEPAIEQLA